MIVLAVVAVLATSAFAYRTVERVRVGSAEFDRALLYANVISETIPAPATLSDAYLLNIALLNAMSPPEVDAIVTRLQQAEDAYRASITRWTTELRASSSPDAPGILSTLDEIAVPAERFWSLVNNDIVAAARGGDPGTALPTVFGSLREAFQQHHDLGDRLYAELQAAQTAQEDQTTRNIEHERNVAIVFVSALVLALVITGLLLHLRLKRARLQVVHDEPVSDGMPIEPVRAHASAGII
jgi:hypothetical protein